MNIIRNNIIKLFIPFACVYLFDFGLKSLIRFGADSTTPYYIIIFALYPLLQSLPIIAIRNLEKSKGIDPTGNLKEVGLVIDNSEEL